MAKDVSAETSMSRSVIRELVFHSDERTYTVVKGRGYQTVSRSSG